MHGMASQHMHMHTGARYDSSHLLLAGLHQLLPVLQLQGNCIAVARLGLRCAQQLVMSPARTIHPAPYLHTQCIDSH